MGAAAAAALKKAKDVMQAVQSRYGNNGLVLEVQVNADGQLKEAVTTADVASDLARASVAGVEAADIEMEDISELGSNMAKITLHPDVSFQPQDHCGKEQDNFLVTRVARPPSPCLSLR